MSHTVVNSDFGGNVRIEDVIPTDQGLTVTAEVDEDGPQNSSWALTSTTVHEDDTEYGARWTVGTYAICSYPIDGWELMPEVDSDSDTRGQSEPGWCPQGKAALSAAGYFDDDNGTALSHNLYGVARCVNL